jgi:tRNA(Ile)-lysidine synthase
VLNADRVTAPFRRTLNSIRSGSTAKIAIALSGGGDSMALACLAHGFLAGRGEQDRLFAVTVDHGLRPESAGEAERAGEFCAALGIDHEIRRWDGDKPAAGLQAAARDARYRLLAEAARNAGCGMVLTGHTLDDQAETVAMRQARGPGRGLSGIAPATLYARRTWFVRPLIVLRRADLRAFLKERGQDWVDDPSNFDPRFERVRLRGSLSKHACEPAEFRAAFETRREEAEKAAAILADDVCWRFDREARTVDLVADAPVGREGFSLALAIAMGWAGCNAHLPSGSVLEKAVAYCADAPAGRKMTAAGCLLSKAQGRIRIGREARNARTAGFGFDYLLPSPDFAAAAVLAARVGAKPYPPPPLRGYPD